MAHLVKDAFRCTSRALQRRLEPQSVAYSHWTLLRVLWQTDGITQRQLSEQAGVTEPSTFAALQRMEKLGYVSRQKLRGNGKEVRVFLAPKGAGLRTTIVAAAEDVNRVALAGIPEADIEATRRTLLAMIGNLTAELASTPAVPGAVRRRRAPVKRGPGASAPIVSRGRSVNSADD